MKSERIYNAFKGYIPILEALKSYFENTGQTEISELIKVLLLNIDKILKLYTLINVSEKQNRSFADIYDSRKDYLCYYENNIFENFAELYKYCKNENSKIQNLTPEKSGKLFVYSVLEFSYCIKTRELKLLSYKSLIEA